MVPSGSKCLENPMIRWPIKFELLLKTTIEINAEVPRKQEDGLFNITQRDGEIAALYPEDRPVQQSCVTAEKLIPSALHLIYKQPVSPTDSKNRALRGRDRGKASLYTIEEVNHDQRNGYPTAP